MHFRDLRTGDCFRFSSAPSITYEYHGNGWYGLPEIHGSWPRADNPPVEVVSRPLTALEMLYAQYTPGSRSA
jgi:hypothetical protein